MVLGGCRSFLLLVTTSPTAIYANITQTGRIWVYCSWFWVVLVGFVDGFGWFCWWFWVVLLVVLGRFGWFWVVPCFSNYAFSLPKCGRLGVMFLKRLVAQATYARTATLSQKGTLQNAR